MYSQWEASQLRPAAFLAMHNFSGLLRRNGGIRQLKGTVDCDPAGAPCLKFGAGGWPEYEKDADALPASGCAIMPEMRGITPRQLLALHDFLREHVCRSPRNEAITPTLETIAVSDCIAHVITSATAIAGCSYVELVADGGAEPVVRCPAGHIRMGRRRVLRSMSYESMLVSFRDRAGCTSCGKSLEGEAFWECWRCQLARCAECSAAPPPAAAGAVPRAALQAPEWVVSCWYTAPPRPRTVGGPDASIYSMNSAVPHELHRIHTHLPKLCVDLLLPC